MSTKIYYLDDARTQPLKITWNWRWKNLAVEYQDQEVGRFATSSQLKQGNTFELPDGRRITVQLLSRSYQPQLELLLDGHPLPGSNTHPQEQFKQARYVLWFMAAANIGLGLVAEIWQVSVLLALGLGVVSVILGLGFLGLDWWARVRLTPWALYIAIAIIVLDAIGTLVLTAQGEAGSNGGGLIMRVFIVVTLVRGVTGVKELRAQRKQEQAALNW